jgi:hypothetical protein
MRFCLHCKRKYDGAKLLAANDSMAKREAAAEAEIVAVEAEREVPEEVAKAEVVSVEGFLARLQDAREAKRAEARVAKREARIAKRAKHAAMRVAVGCV